MCQEAFGVAGSRGSSESKRVLGRGLFTGEGLGMLGARGIENCMARVPGLQDQLARPTDLLPAVPVTEAVQREGQPNS